MSTTMTQTRTYTIHLGGRRLAYDARSATPPRVSWCDPGDIIRVDWRDDRGRVTAWQLRDDDELVIEHVGRDLYAISVLAPDDTGHAYVAYPSDTRPRPMRVGPNRWWRIRLTGVTGRHHVAYLRDMRGVTIG